MALNSKVKLYASLSIALSVFGFFALENATLADTSVVQMPEEYVTGRAPAGFNAPQALQLAPPPNAERNREGEQALNGTVYTVIAPTFDGSDGNLSYFRFINMSGAPTTIDLSVVGSVSAITYGTATFNIPDKASPQYSMDEILSEAGAGSLLTGDTGYSFYVKSPSAGNYVGYQHVIYNGTNGFFENMSVCTFDPAFDYSIINSALVNVHTSVLSGYPTLVFLHNYANSDRDYQVTITDSRTGVVQGVVNIATTANTSYASPMSFFEDLVDWIPSNNQQHANLIFEPLIQGSTYTAIVGQGIQNSSFNSLVNMTQVCGIHHQ